MITPFKVTQRAVTISFPEGAPDLLFAKDRHVAPLYVKVRRHFDGAWSVEATGHTRKADGGLSKVTCGYMIPVVPEWLMGVLDCVHAGADQ